MNQKLKLAHQIYYSEKSPFASWIRLATSFIWRLYSITDFFIAWAETISPYSLSFDSTLM